MFNPTTASKIFLDAMPDGFLEASLRCLFSTCHKSVEFCENYFPKPEAHDLKGHVWRGFFESEFRSVAVGSTEMSGLPVTNHRRTAYHTRISFGPVQLTASRVQNPKQIVRRAEFRNGYASSSQLELFEEQKAPPANAPLYAIYLYGLDWALGLPSFADIVFPDSKCARYVDRLSLFAMFPTLVNQLFEQHHGPAPHVADDIEAPDVTIVTGKQHKKAT